MIRIIRGKPSAIRTACASLFDATDSALWVEEREGSRRYWAGFRQLLPQLRAHLGDGPVEEALHRHKIVASLILGRMRNSLDASEQAQFHELSARLTSHLSHNWFIDRPVLLGLAEILGELFSAKKFTLFIPSLCCPDLTTLALVLAVRRRMPLPTPDLVIGYALDPEDHFVDDNGLAWGYTKSHADGLYRALMALGDEMLVEQAEEPSGPLFDGTPSFTLDLWDDDLDGAAQRIMETAPAPLSREASTLVISAAERAFQAFGRDVAIRLALKLLEKEPDLSDDQRARVHEIIGLAAHNWQFGTDRGNDGLTEFLEHHFGRALALERDENMRVALLYRMAVTLGRRKKDFKGAMEFANLAIEAVRASALSRQEKLYQESWARNIRAYLFMRQGDLTSALADSEACLEFTEEITSPIENASRDFKFTRTTVADNNLTLCRLLGDDDRLYDRMKGNIAFLEQDPPSFGGRFSAPSWIFLCRRKYRLDMALKAAMYGLDDSGQDYPSFRWYFLSQLGDLWYRLGDASKSLEYFEQTRHLRQCMRQVDGMAFLSLPVAAARAGCVTRAIEGLQEALDHPKTDSPSKKAEILAAMAVTYARAGDRLQAEDKINSAIDFSLKEGVRDVMLGVARTAGDVAHLLGDREGAREAYLQAVDLASIDGETDPAPEHVIGSLIGLAECGEASSDHLRRSLRLMPRALKEDSESWWELRRLITHLTEEVQKGMPLEPEDEKALSVIVTAAYQRADCSQPLSSLTRILPMNVQELLIEV